jgi:hypothetical protein
MSSYYDDVVAEPRAVVRIRVLQNQLLIAQHDLTNEQKKCSFQNSFVIGNPKQTQSQAGMSLMFSVQGS